MSNSSVGPGLGPDGPQKAAIDAILSIIETSHLPNPDAYRTTTILPDGAGISYGKHQSTDRSGTLDTIVMEYIREGGQHAAELEPFLSMLATDFSTGVDPQSPPESVLKLMAVLRKCGRDPIMHQVQDQVFERQYWRPALEMGQKLRLELPLSYLLIYDTTVQSGINGVSTIRMMFPAVPPYKGGDEKVWAIQYAASRLAWLKAFRSSSAKKQELVRRSAYRMRSIIDDLIEPGNWQLWTPLTFRGVTIR